MGWQEGEGLGKEKQGITEHVRVSKKKDNSGVGVDAQQKAASNWTFNTTTFDNILKNLKVIAADTIKGDDKQEELTVDDLKHEKKLDSKKVTRPQGRYKNRELGKILQGKSQVDLDAILGYGSKPKEVWPETVVSKWNTKNAAFNRVCEPDCDSGASSDTQDEGNDATSAGPPPAAIKLEQSMEEIPVGNMAIEWWGTKHGFVRAGALGQNTSQNARDEKESTANKSQTQDLEAIRSNGRTSFCEQDQEDLYKLVQDKATKGRQGLGIAGRPKKIGGAHWKGQKVMLDTSDDDESENLVVMDVQVGGIQNMDAVRKGDECKRKATSSGCDLEGEDKSKPKKPKQENKQKWKRLCRQLLQEVPAQTMSIKRLHRLIVGESDLFPSPDVDDHEQSVCLFKGKLNKSSKFIIEGKKVSLINAKAS